ncbi:Cl channel CLC-3 [Naviculisporaceae sp. PSN 640]
MEQCCGMQLNNVPKLRARSSHRPNFQLVMYGAVIFDIHTLQDSRRWFRSRSYLSKSSVSVLHPLLSFPGPHPTATPYDADVESLISSAVSKDELAMHTTTLGERLPYNDYTTIDWLHDLVKDNVRHRRHRRGLAHDRRHGSVINRVRVFLWESWDAAQGWVAAALIGIFTASVAFVVDISVVILSDWKEGHCARGMWLNRRECCVSAALNDNEVCDDWIPWGGRSSYEFDLVSYATSYAIYILFALLFGLIAGAVTMTTKTKLPTASPSNSMSNLDLDEKSPAGKTMYMSSGSGIPEIKTLLSGFVIPDFLSPKVLFTKALGATFAVSTGMCLGKEGPFVHISACVGDIVSNLFPKFQSNSAKKREMLAIACSAGLSVAFGAPIGGVLFSYEEISTYFPRRVMWRSFLCSLVAAVCIKALNPMGTGKLVLFETGYGVDYEAVHYLVFVGLGVMGGIYGGIFCRANYLWSKWFRRLKFIRESSPVVELLLVVFITALLQYPNLLIRQTGDVVMEELLVDCSREIPGQVSWLCRQEERADKGVYYAWLISGTLVKLLLTIITFGCKVPSGIIIPSLDAGALFGRMIGQLVPGISPGIFAMVGSAAFLAGVSRMTVSLAVIMFELTGEVNFILPFMVAILTSKWVADAISKDGVYDLAQHLLGHPFLDSDHALDKVRRLDPDVYQPDQGHNNGTMEDLIPPPNTMDEISLFTGPDYRVRKTTLQEKLARLQARGLMDAGLVLVNERGICHGYLPEAELEFALAVLAETETGEDEDEQDGEVDLVDGVVADFVDRSPLTVASRAPVEYAVEMFGKLGLRYLIVVEEETARVVGVVIKKRLLSYLDSLR